MESKDIHNGTSDTESTATRRNSSGAQSEKSLIEKSLTAEVKAKDMADQNKDNELPNDCGIEQLIVVTDRLVKILTASLPNKDGQDWSWKVVPSAGRPKEWEARLSCTRYVIRGNPEKDERANKAYNRIAGEASQVDAYAALVELVDEEIAMAKQLDKFLARVAKRNDKLRWEVKFYEDSDGLTAYLKGFARPIHGSRRYCHIHGEPYFVKQKAIDSLVKKWEGS